MKTHVYNQKGEQVKTVEAPEEIFSLSWNGDLVHQVITAMRANARISFAHTKDRSEVRGGGKKPWRQKGTGRARHGSRRSPLWRSGGATFGPRNEERFAQKINKKMKNKALFTLLSRKFSDGNILFLDDLSLDTIKTNKAKEVLEALGSISGFEEISTRTKNAVCIYLPEGDENVEWSFRNFGNVELRHYTHMNPLDISRFAYIVIVDPEKIFDFLTAKTVSRSVQTESPAPAEK